MHPRQMNSKETTKMAMPTMHNKKRLAQMKIDYECENDNSNSSTDSSIIDPGDENSISFEDELYASPAKKVCTNFDRWASQEEKNKQDRASLSSPSTPPEPPRASQSPDKGKPSRSFLIKDILSGSSKQMNDPTSANKSESMPASFIRPWDSETNPATYLNQLNQAASLFQSIHYNALSGLHPSSLSLFQNAYANTLKNYRVMPNRRPRSADDDSRSDRSESPESPASASANAVSSPLDALFEMTSKAFDRKDNADKTSDPSSDHLNLFNNRASQIKKKRKSRTAFTNHQIFELEKRFLYQKYLSPADRDEIAQSLGLTNAQVITWFQNRRAKLKRDVEELKKDVDAAKITSVHNTILDNIQDLSLLKKNEIVAALHQHAQHSGN